MDDLRTIKNLLIGIFILMMFSAVYFARDLMLPIMVGLLLALTLSPVVRALARLGVPEVISAVFLVFAAAAIIGFGGYILSGPISVLLSDLPGLGQQVRVKFSSVLSTLQAAQDVTKSVEGITNGSDANPTVAIEQPGLLSLAAGTLTSFMSLTAAGLVLAVFLLASGNLFYEKLVAALPTFADKRRAVKTARDVERQISRYFLTITLINATLGLCVGTALFLIEFDNAVLWGAMAFALNFLPFIGAVIGSIGVAAFGVIASDTLLSGLLPAAIYLGMSTLEGQFLTPAILGRRLELNTVSVFLTLLVWTWLWGIPGALMAVPFLVMVKVICDNVEGLRVFGSFLGAAAPPVIAPDPDPAANA